MKIGIIGFGRLGKLLTKYLSKDATVYVYDHLEQESYAESVEKCGAKIATLEEVSSLPVVIPIVPISSFEETIKQMAKYMKEGALVVDVCSVKEIPVKIMQDNLPPNVHILATHPMFGPDSAKKTLFGRKIVLCKVRIPDVLYNDIKNYLEMHGLKTIETTPVKHDEEISHSLLLTHFIGRSLMDLGANELLVDTVGYRRLMKILETVQNDSWQLFKDMNKFNKFSELTRKQFLASLDKINRQIEE